jgi:hypothetical protein
MENKFEQKIKAGKPKGSSSLLHLIYSTKENVKQSPTMWEKRKSQQFSSQHQKELMFIFYHEFLNFSTYI